MCRCGKVIKGAVGLVKATFKLQQADPQTIQTRREICRGCPEAVPCKNKPETKCNCRQCGCLLKAKTSLSSEKCPLGKW